MARLEFSTNHPLAQKIWAKQTERDTLQKLWFKELIGDGSGSIIQRKRDLAKDPGDSVRFRLRGLLSGRGRTEGEVLYGNEEKMSYTYDDLLINELDHAVEIPTEVNISNQRFVAASLRDEAKDVLVDWYAERFEVCMMNHLAGNTLVVDNPYRGNNAILAPSSGRVLRAGGAATDQALGSSNIMDLSIIDAALEKTARATPKFRPGPNGKFVLIISPEQATDVMRDSSGDGWLTIALSKIQGGSTKELDNLTEKLGTYKGVDIYVSKYIPVGINSSTGAAIPTVHRAVFLGAQAAVMAFAGIGDRRGQMFTWAEESKDYGRWLGVGGLTIWGIKKTRFTTDGSTGEDYGVMTISTYAAAHTY